MLTSSEFLVLPVSELDCVDVLLANLVFCSIYSGVIPAV